jgi:alanine racemase
VSAGAGTGRLRRPRCAPGTERGEERIARGSGPCLRIDLDAVAANTRLLAGRAGGRLMAVVKANGFGHGAVDVARTALANGAGRLGVVTVAEALELRAAGLTAPLLSWLNPADADFGAALRAGVEIAVPGERQLRAVAGAAAATGVTARVHLQLDVGMARDGEEPERWGPLCRMAAAAEAEGLLRVTGVMGHLGCTDPAHDCAADATRVFTLAARVADAAGLRPRVRHLAATAATLTDPRTHFDLCRVGAGLVGIDPSGTTALRPAMTLTAPVVAVRTVPDGARVGYGHAHTTSGPTRLALLPLGYADGVPRAASGRAEVLLGGRRCPVAGLVSMDQTVVDTTALPDVAPGDTAVLFGPGDAGEPTPADWARWAGTIPHEIVTGVGSRVRRLTVPTAGTQEKNA